MIAQDQLSNWTILLSIVLAFCVGEFSALWWVTLSAITACVFVGRGVQPPLGRYRAKGKAEGLAMGASERTKETKTAEELAAMIREDLSKVGGCPKGGVTVTVYGMPWRAMLTFGAAAGPVRNKAELQRFFEIITERLQRRYDVV